MGKVSRTVSFKWDIPSPRLVRLLVLALLALTFAATAAAQDNTTGNETNETAPDANATPTDAPAEPAGPLSITLETHTQGGGGYFTFQGETAKNPTLRVEPGQEVTVTIVATDEGVHNFCFGDAKTCTSFVTAAGETQTITFRAPESGTIEYFCSPHKGAGMKGNVAVGAADVDTGDDAGGEESAISGETIDLGTYSPACAGKVAPAQAAEGIVGMPTLQDYIDACTPQEGPVETSKHAADLVIPISWGLIAIGIAGVVWVHKYYKP